MAFGFKQSIHNAVLFLNENKVVKEMLYSEFEAVLDGIVGEPEYAGQTCHAVYLKIDMRMNILGAVFFMIDFDEKGAADRRWNLPLEQLAETAAFGPELNGQSVRVASSSQCQIPWHHEHLWEPDLSVNSNTFKLLDTAVKRNRMGLLVDTSETESDQATNKELNLTSVNTADVNNATTRSAAEAERCKAKQDVEKQDEERYKMAQNIKKQRLYIASLKTRHQQELETLRIEFSCEKETFIIQLQEAQLKLSANERLSQQLMEELEHLREQNRQQRGRYEKQIAETMNNQGLDFSKIQKQFRQDLQQKLIEETSGLRAQLEMREVEVHYREEQIQTLTTELDALRANQLLKQSENKNSEIAELDALGVHFVVTLPGVGPVMILLKDLPEFRAAPSAYLADRLGIEEAIYEVWLEHANRPVCLAKTTDDCVCERPIDIAAPKTFIAGISDRCLTHQNSVSSVGSASKH